MLRLFSALLTLIMVVVVVAVSGVAYAFWHFGRDLPDYQQLSTYQPPTVTRVHAGDGRILDEWATERRVFVPIEAIPKRVWLAFLSAEDKNFYSHPGIDVLSIARAAVNNLQAIGTGRRPEGASTITQQVAKNFLLTSDVSIQRKIREAILAFRIEEALTKDRILELYLNEIYLGFGSYGVAAAALNYFNKSLDELTLAEAAYLAALPKAPNNYHPIRRTETAIARRNWVLSRMLQDGHINEHEARAAMDEPLVVRRRDTTEVARGDYFAEDVRRELARHLGTDAIYGGGLSVHTSLDPRLQEAADRALTRGLLTYDRRHGWRGPIEHFEQVSDDWAPQLATVELPRAALEGWTLALVVEIAPDYASVGFVDGSTGIIPMSEMTWARPTLDGQRVGQQPRSAGDVLAVGDVVLVEGLDEESAEQSDDGPPHFALRQIPDVNGALVALDPHTGRVLAMSGGFSYGESEFNRATQAQRQTGSAFKPFVYLAALEAGYSPATIVIDGPFAIDQGPGLPKWRPTNYSDQFYGPTPMRVGLEQSRNLMTVRMAHAIGMDKVVDTAMRLDLFDRMDPFLSFALGAGETTLARMTTGFAMLVNGGKRVRPSLVDRVQDRHGQTIFRQDERPCQGCLSDEWDGLPPPKLPDDREQVTDPVSAYQLVSMLEGVVLRGTATSLRAIGKPLAGKTGTTNDFHDAWFVGFSPDLAVGVYVGFDQPRTLGARETGGAVAAPIFGDFMRAALEDAPAIPFRIPDGVRMMRVVRDTGQPARAGDSGVIWEAFRPGTEPDRQPALTIDGSDDTSPFTATAPTSPGSVGTGGLY